MKRLLFAVSSFLLIPAGFVLPAAPPQAAQEGASAAKTLAVVNGVSITKDQVQSAAQADLERLEMQQLQLQAEYRRNQHQIIQANLDRIVEVKLLEAEAAKRSVTREELLKVEVQSKVQPANSDDVNAFYEANKAQIGVAKEQVAGQILQYLQEMRQKEAHNRFLAGLREKYGVQSFLEPLRTQVETASHPARGSQNAPLTLVEFSDFECPYCSRLFSTLKQVEKTYGDRMRIVYRQFPLANHPHAQKAAEASLCANEQGHFWEMHDLMFQEQTALAVSDLKTKAASLKLDAASFEK
ncbi:MAG: thioredoxin domain-containing protein, partial [Acidobacteria bacterium]|nr:thioredoxin domain-containing protein [Acidobacteriota bacterium]